MSGTRVTLRSSEPESGEEGRGDRRKTTALSLGPTRVSDWSSYDRGRTVVDTLRPKGQGERLLLCESTTSPNVPCRCRDD